MSVTRLRDRQGDNAPRPRGVVTGNGTHRWERRQLVGAVSAFLRRQRRAHLRKELQGVLDRSYSYVNRLVNGTLDSVPGHVLLTLDGHFNGELLRELRGLPEPDEASAQILHHLDSIRRLAQ